MKDNKGQALVEFVIILPIFLLLIISMIDIGNIIFKKINLENELDVIGDMYRAGDYNNINDYLVDKDILYNVTNEDDFVNIKLTKDINILSPILILITGDDYKLEVSKTLYNRE